MTVDRAIRLECFTLAGGREHTNPKRQRGNAVRSLAGAWG